jgi:hypothetical protein
MWTAGAVLVLVGGAAGLGSSSTFFAAPNATASMVEQVRAEQRSAVLVRPLGDRSAFDVRNDHLRPLLIGWSAATGAAVGLLVVMFCPAWAPDVASDRSRERRFDRGPPAPLSA